MRVLQYIQQWKNRDPFSNLTLIEILLNSSILEFLNTAITFSSISSFYSSGKVASTFSFAVLRKIKILLKVGLLIHSTSLTNYLHQFQNCSFQFKFSSALIQPIARAKRFAISEWISPMKKKMFNSN